MYIVYGFVLMKKIKYKHEKIKYKHQICTVLCLIQYQLYSIMNVFNEYCIILFNTIVKNVNSIIYGNLLEMLHFYVLFVCVIVAL